MKKRLKVGTPVIIHWFFAHADLEKSGNPKDLLDTKCELLDIGFYLGAKGDFVSLAFGRDVHDHKYYRHDNHIPKVNIISIEALAESEYIRNLLHSPSPGLKQGTCDIHPKKEGCGRKRAGQ